MRVPWTARRSNQSILKEISPEYSLEGLMLKLKPQYFGHLIRGTNSLEKTLMLRKIEGRRRRGRQRMRCLDGITNPMDMRLSKLQEFVIDREIWSAIVHVVAKNWTWLSDVTELIRLGFPVGFLSKEIPFFSYFTKSYTFSLIKNKFCQCFLCIYCHDHMALPI